MSRLVILVALLVGCKDSSTTAPPPAAKSNDYCRGLGAYTPGAVSMSTEKAGSSSVPAHTFSVVARDPVTGDLGVAVQSN